MKTARFASLLRATACVAALPAAIASSAFAQSRSDAKSHETFTTERAVENKSTLKRGDRRFITKAAKLGMEEVRLSRLAAARASSPEVRQFAQMLAESHDRANSELTQLATNKNVVLSMDDNPNLEKWTEKTGAKFDQDYLDEMIGAHEDSVELLEERAKEAEDADIAAYAQKHLPAMQEHLRKAKELRGEKD